MYASAKAYKLMKEIMEDKLASNISVIATDRHVEICKMMEAVSKQYPSMLHPFNT